MDRLSQHFWPSPPPPPRREGLCSHCAHMLGHKWPKKATTKRKKFCSFCGLCASKYTALLVGRKMHTWCPCGCRNLCIISVAKGSASKPCTNVRVHCLFVTCRWNQPSRRKAGLTDKHPPPSFATCANSTTASAASPQAPRSYATLPLTGDAPHTSHHVTLYQGSGVNCITLPYCLPSASLPSTILTQSAVNNAVAYQWLRNFRGLAATARLMLHHLPPNATYPLAIDPPRRGPCPAT